MTRVRLVGFTAALMLSAVLVVTLAGNPLMTSAGQPVQYNVTKTEDTADATCDELDCSLREAIRAANQNPEGGTVNVPAGTYVLTLNGTDDTAMAGDLDILQNVTVVGAGPGQTIIDGNDKYTVFHMLYHPQASGDVLTLIGLSVMHGRGDYAGGIQGDGRVTLVSTVVADNVGKTNAYAGGIYSDYNVIIRDTLIDNNIATGEGSTGGFYLNEDGTLEDVAIEFNSASGDSSTGGLKTDGLYEVAMSRLSLSDNTATGTGATGAWHNGDYATATDLTVSSNTGGIDGTGGIFSANDLTIMRGAINHNTASAGGVGGLWNDDGIGNLENVTLYANSDTGDFGTGGIFTWTEMHLINVTIVSNDGGNDGGGGIWNEAGTDFTMRNSIIAYNTNFNCGAGQDPISLGYNIDSGDSCEMFESTDMPDTDPLVDPLSDNGGFAQTISLGAGSPAIDAIEPSECPPPDTDARGFTRPAGAGCDIGAYEVGASETTPTPTAAPGQQVVWGDDNCSDAADPVDSLLTLRFDGGLSTNTGTCPAMGVEVEVTTGSPHLWGDVDCNEAVDPIDSLKLLRFDGGLTVAQEPGCPEIGAEVELSPV